MNNLINVEDYLKGLQGRMQLKAPALQSRINPFLEKQIEAMEDPEKAKANRLKWLEMAKKAYVLEDGGAFNEMQEVRREIINNWVIAESHALNFFRVVTLAENEEPVIEVNTDEEVPVRYLGSDGTPKLFQAHRDRSRTVPDWFQLSSDWFEYTLVDPRHGREADLATVNVNIAHDLEKKLDKILWDDFIKANTTISAFDFTNADRSKRTMNFHSSVVLANIPPSNDLTAANSTAGKQWRKECIDVITRYQNRWANAFPGRMVKALETYVPSLDNDGWLDDITLTAQANYITDQIMKEGRPTRGFGGEGGLNTVPIVDLDPAGYAGYTRFDHPIGYVFLKPTLNNTLRDDRAITVARNKAREMQSFWVCVCVVEPWRINVTKTTYSVAP